MTTTFLYNETAYTVDQLAQVIREQLAGDYRLSDNLRTAVMYCPKIMTGAEFAEAASRCGINAGSARNRYSEVRRWQKELGEI